MRFKNTTSILITTNINPIQNIKEGFSYAFASIPIRSILLLMVTFSLMVMPYSSLMPIFAIKILHGDAHTLSFLLIGSGLGSLIGGIYVVRRQSVLGLEKLIVFALASSGIALILFAFSHFLWLSILILVAVGFSSILQISSSNTLIQTIVEDDKRGRVMSIFTMSFLGMSPFGSLLNGTLAEHSGAPWTLLIDGLVCLSCAVFFIRLLPNLEDLIKLICVR